MKLCQAAEAKKKSHSWLTNNVLSMLKWNKNDNNPNKCWHLNVWHRTHLNEAHCVCSDVGSNLKYRGKKRSELKRLLVYCCCCVFKALEAKHLWEDGPRQASKQARNEQKMVRNICWRTSCAKKKTISV